MSEPPAAKRLRQSTLAQRPKPVTTQKFGEALKIIAKKGNSPNKVEQALKEISGYIKTWNDIGLQEKEQFITTEWKGGINKIVDIFITSMTRDKLKEHKTIPNKAMQCTCLSTFLTPSHGSSSSLFQTLLDGNQYAITVAINKMENNPDDFYALCNCSFLLRKLIVNNSTTAATAAAHHQLVSIQNSISVLVEALQNNRYDNPILLGNICCILAHLDFEDNAATKKKLVDANARDIIFKIYQDAQTNFDDMINTDDIECYCIDFLEKYDNA